MADSPLQSRPWAALDKGGVVRGNGRQRYQLVVRLDKETHDQVRSRAIAARTSIAEQVRLLIEWGLEADKAP